MGMDSLGMDSLGSYAITNSCELLQKYYDDSQRFLCVQTISTEGLGPGFSYWAPIRMLWGCELWEDGSVKETF